MLHLCIQKNFGWTENSLSSHDRWSLSAHLFQNVHFLVLFVFSQKYRPLSAFAKSLMELICQTDKDLKMPRSIKPFFDTFRSHLTLYPSIAIHFAPAVNVFWKCTYIMQITNHCMILTFSPQLPCAHNLVQRLTHSCLSTGGSKTATMKRSCATIIPEI